MTVYSMAARHAAGKGEADVVFTVVKRANDAISLYGKETVINASYGTIFDDEGNFAALPTISEYYRQLPDGELMNYTPIPGLPEFIEAALDFTFQGYRPENACIKAVATPGGTGAIRHVFSNYLDPSQKVLLPDWFWAPYQTIAREAGREIDNYALFDENHNFTMTPLKEKVTQLLNEQDNLVVLFNTPAHNPTGHSMSVQEWEDILEFLKHCARDKNKKITILVDMAYIDYAGPPEKTRQFMKLFGKLPENMLVTIAFSMSKSFLVYGMRSGALIGISSVPEIAEEFFRINSYSNRGNWSNGSRGAQKILAAVMGSPELKSKTDLERNKYTEMINKRADIFLMEAQKVDLKTLPYFAGFFITIPAAESKIVTERLAEQNIFAVPMKKGVRIAICGIPTGQIPGLAKIIKRATY